MADVLQALERRRPGHAMPRATLPVDDGHQVRLIWRGTGLRRRVVVTCRCQMTRPRPWTKTPTGDTNADIWTAYNALAHDPAAGPFAPQTPE